MSFYSIVYYSRFNFNTIIQMDIHVEHMTLSHRPSSMYVFMYMHVGVYICMVVS